MSEHSEWDAPVARQFESLLLSNLYAVFQNAIKQVVECGYSADVVFKAIAREGFYHRGKDPLSNIVNETLLYLKEGRDFDSRDIVFEDLKQLVEFTMLEMVNVLKEVKPSLCTTEAMWWLLMCDMILSQACAEEGYLLEETSIKETLAGSSSQSSFQPQSADRSLLICNESDCDTKFHPPETLKFGSFPSLLNSQNSPAPEARVPEKGNHGSTSAGFEKSLAATVEYLPSASKRYASEEKPKTDGKLHHKRGYVARHKSSHLDWCYKQYGKSVSKSGKVCSTGGVVVEKRMKLPSEIFVPPTKGPLSKARGTAKGPLTVGSPQVLQHDASSVSGADDFSKVSMKESKPSTDAANSAVDYSLEKKASSNPNLRTSVFPEISDYYAAIPFDKSLGKHVPQTKKDELVLKLVSQAQQLQDELQKWTKWGNQKVMQAAQRLSRDKAELKALRQEKEEAERYKKEKKILEENAAKRLLEMESALNNAIYQADKAKSTLCKLDAESSVLKKEMKAAKSLASEAAASCQEAVKREQQAQKDSQSWEGQKGLLLEELMAQKQKVAELQQEVSKKKNLHSKVEAKWKQEKMLKENFLAQAAAKRNELEELEARTKEEQARIKEEAEQTLNKYFEDIKKLEREVSELRLKSDASKIAALKSGIDGNFGIAHGEIDHVMKESQDFIVSEEVADFRDNLESGGLRRERECFMCLSEEMSVVFLPCAHQVLCPNCNELHEKQGMKDCPSCRTPIQRRILACFA